MLPRWLKAVLLAVLVVLFSGGLWFSRGYNRFLVQQAYQDLEAVAQQKVGQIAVWQKERLADAAVVMESPFFSQAIARCLMSPEKEGAAQILTRFRSLQRHYRYSNVLMVDAKGKVRLILEDAASPLHDTVTKAMSRAFQDRKPVLTDLHVASGPSDPRIDVVVPIFDGRGSGPPLGAILLRVNARQSLYPLLQSWPTPARTAETILVRRDGDDVLFLNDLRYKKDTALTLRIPLERSETPAVRAVLGETGVVQAKDYRGVDVLSALKPVPETPWFMVVKVDASEALSLARRESFLILALILGVTGLCIAALGVVWQQRSKAHYKALLAAESAHRRVEEHFRVTLLSVGDAVITTDALGRVELLNPVAEKLTGWQQEDGWGKPISEVFIIINEKTRQPVENPVNQVLRRGRVIGLANDTLLISKDGGEIPIEDSAAPIRGTDGETTGVVMVFHDVTDRRRAEAELRAAYDELDGRVRERTAELMHQAQLISLTHDAIIERDMDDRITFWSKGAEETYGWTSGEAVGKIIHLLLDTHFPQGIDAIKEDLFSQGRWDGELIHLKKDGNRIVVMSRRVLRRNENGAPLGILEINNDISERKQVEQQLRQVHKMEAVGALTAGIAHDFNNILASVIGFAELAKNRIEEGSREERYVQRVLDAALRGRELIRRMLTFSRQTEQEKRPLELSSAVKETVRFLRASIPSTINVRMTIESESGLVLGDPVQIQQVIMNLCTNGAHAMKERGGNLDIELSDYSGWPPNISTKLKPGSYMRLVVRDTGDGIPADIIDKIFDPFFTTKSQGEGTGLGLSVVHGIIKGHDGDITVESEPGKGSVFTLFLPKITMERATVREADGPIPTGHERILFVDDEKPLAEMGEAMLLELGYHVVSKTNSREALATLRLDPSRFDLVITDQTMPEMTGMELAKEILTVRADMPIIVCSGFDNSTEGDKAASLGIGALVSKPLTKREMAITIRTVLDR